MSNPRPETLLDHTTHLEEFLAIKGAITQTPQDDTKQWKNPFGSLLHWGSWGCWETCSSSSSGAISGGSQKDPRTVPRPINPEAQELEMWVRFPSVQ
mmetsp:Transcript_17228/g.39963  ORF Transcript_17228/g.39963 Transcript_17228/m.39963 type:complete len:97 (+) Transcript_17228:1417-1707(+)